MKTTICMKLIGAMLVLTCCMACHQEDRGSRDESKTGNRLTYASHEIYYEVHGQGARTLVFIHGWTGSVEHWKYQLDAFPEHRVIAIDLPGNGRSSRTEGVAYSMERFADAVRAVLAAEEVEKAFFFAHSMGFAVVEVIASKYPRLCAGIAAIDGTHFEAPTDAAGQAEWRQGTEAMAAGMVTEKAREDFINMLFVADTPSILKEEVLRISRSVPLPIARAMIAGAAADVKYWLPKKVDIPCLAVYSRAYPLPPTYRNDFARMYPRVEYHQVENVSHFFMLEIPYRLNQLITDFVSRH